MIFDRIYQKKFCESISLYTVNNMKSPDLLCSALLPGTKIWLRPLESEKWQGVMPSKGVFLRGVKRKSWTKEQFLMNIHRQRLHLLFRRQDLIDDYQKYSDNEIARMLGDDSLARTMSEMDEQGKDVWA